MDIYLAATFSRAEEMRAVRSHLVANGHNVVSTWIDVEVEDFKPSFDDKQSLTSAQGYAGTDLNEVRNCEMLLMFTLPDGRGQGHHVEFGFAYALQKKIWIVGPCENIFQAMVPVEHVSRDVPEWFETWIDKGWLPEVSGA